MALYLYCLTWARATPDQQELEGLEAGMPVHFAGFDAVGAVLSPLDATLFTGAEADGRLQDSRWLAPRLARHDGVIAALQGRQPVLPLPFATLFSGRDGLAAWIAANREQITAFLGRVSGCEEWAVKLFLHRAAAEQQLFQQLSGEQHDVLAALSPGRRYLEEQRLKKTLAGRLPGWQEERCVALAERLCAAAAAWQERPLQSRGLEAEDRRLLRNWALLLPQPAVGAWLKSLGQLQARYEREGIELEWSGPWAAYSFRPALTAP